MPLRIVFCGTPAFAVPTLLALAAQPDFEIAGVITQPDRPSGRGQQVSISSVKNAALAAGIPVYQPERIKEEAAQQYLQTAAADLIVIIAYGQIIPARLIAIPRLGWINLHGSLLPKYRGAAPIHWAVANGEKRTGLTTMQIDAGLDTGPMLLKHETEIGADETSPELYARLAEAGAPLMVETLRGLAAGTLKSTPQDDSQKTFAPPLKKEDGRIDWSRRAAEIYNRMRGFQPWPGAFTTFRGKTCQVWGKPAAEAAATAPIPATSDAPAAPGTLSVKNGEVWVAAGHGTSLKLETVQMEGRKKVAAREFANGARLAPGEKFGD
jgi:methionyl-tRNA formyltransferase